MVFLLAFSQVMPPLPLGQFPDRAQCEQERAALLRAATDAAITDRLTIVCVEPEAETGRRRFEFRPSQPR